MNKGYLSHRGPAKAQATGDCTCSFEEPQQKPLGSFYNVLAHIRPLYQCIMYLFGTVSYNLK